MKTEPFGQRLRRLRLRKRLSVQELATLASVSPSTYREWEYGRAIRGEPYAKLATALGVSLSDLLIGEGYSKDVALELTEEAGECLRKLKAELMKVV